MLNTYIITPLIIDDLIPRNPIAGLNLTHPPGAKEPAHTRGGRSMDHADYSPFLTWLLDLDPASLAPPRVPRLQPHWRDLTVAKWHNAIDLSLLQMATGLRQTEGRRLTWPLVQVDDQGVMSIKIPKDVAKTRDARVVLVLEPRVAKRLLERRDRAGGIGYVIGAPSDPTKVWHRSNCGAAVAALYQRAATELGIDVLLTERSHMWRTTLRTFYQGQAPDAVLNAQFGHSQAIADKHYTDYRRLDDLADAAGLGTSQQPQATAPLRHPSRYSKSCLGLLFDLLFRPLSGPFARGLSPHPTDASSLGPMTRDRRAR
ncbi:hypothetical protein [Nocardioides sp.]|uniref:hypothetical protein n=1 Tax=Nocardioides sp. TaxID=35761 RepID=UPI0019887B21|nr:hypothetical protein [Nocardioides sp.]MBC7277077.1 hypothetical protein [Nocardioides sp.]